MSKSEEDASAILPLGYEPEPDRYSSLPRYRPSVFSKYCVGIDGAKEYMGLKNI
jgi:hypothetical protein